jgi:nicotinamidase-related amidase
MMAHANGVLERDRAALLVIDIQERLAAAMEHRERVTHRSGLLARTAALVGMPVIATRQYPRGLGDIEPQLIEVFSECGAEQVDKVAFNCFRESGFIDAFERTGRTQLLIAGMETHICVCQTALAALARGLEVHVCADACASRDDRNHDLALTRLAHAGAVITSWESAAYELVGAAGSDEFKELLSIVKG